MGTTERKKIDNLALYKLVNSCETREQLAEAIREIGKQNNGKIYGRKSCFDAEDMAVRCEKMGELGTILNYLTREYGIRQQMMLIMYYEHIESDDKRFWTVDVVRLN